MEQLLKKVEPKVVGAAVSHEGEMSKAASTQLLYAVAERVTYTDGYYREFGD